MKMNDLKNFLAENAAAPDVKPDALVGRLLTAVEVDLVSGGDGYCQTTTGGGYSQTTGSTYNQKGGTYSQTGGNYTMSCPAPGTGGSGTGKDISIPPANDSE